MNEYLIILIPLCLFFLKAISACRSLHHVIKENIIMAVLVKVLVAGLALAGKNL